MVSLPYMMLQLPSKLLDGSVDLQALLRKSRTAHGQTQAELDTKKAFVEAATLDRQEKLRQRAIVIEYNEMIAASPAAFGRVMELCGLRMIVSNCPISALTSVRPTPACISCGTPDGDPSDSFLAFPPRLDQRQTRHDQHQRQHDRQGDLLIQQDHTPHHG